MSQCKDKDSALNQPDLIGRETELAKLRDALENTISGKGSTIFIAGEAGIGKTRLVSELMKEAEAKNIQIIQGRCLLESLEPLMSIKTALREAGLFHLISGDAPPLIVSTYLMNDAGLLIAKAERGELDLDPYIFGSMLNAVGSFVKDSMAMVDKVECSGGLNILGYKEYKILIEECGVLNLATVIKGNLSEFLVGDMRNILADIQTEYSDTLKNWDGDLEKCNGIDAILSKLIKSGKYDGKFLVDDPKIRQENLFDNVLLGFLRLSEMKPILLFLDDLQWADPSTLALVNYLTRNTKKDRVLILGDYRPEDIIQSWDGKTHHLEIVMQNMGRDDLLEKIELKRLHPQNTKELIDSVLGNNYLEQKFFEKIFKETDGTPFFVLEVVKLLAEEKTIVPDEKGVWTLTDNMEKIDIPTKVYDVVKRRLDRLMKEQREMLECASVIGEEFQSEVVCKTVGQNKIQLLRNLSDIEKTHQLIHYLKDKYRFDHAKVREVLYNGIGEELRREYHRIVGDTIAELHKDNLDAVVNELAYHYLQANDLRAGEFLCRAGDRAKERYANEEAIRLYINALAVLKEKENLKKTIDESSPSKECDSDAEKVRISMLIGNLYLDLGLWNNSIKYYEDALRVAQKTGNDTIEVKALISLGLSKLHAGNNKEAEKNYIKAAEIAGKRDDMQNMGEIQRGLGYVHWRKGENDDAIEHYNQSISYSRNAGDSSSMAKTFIELGNVYNNWGQNEKAIEYYIKSISEMEKLNDYFELARAYNNIGDTYLHMKEWDKAIESLEKCRLASEKIGNRNIVAWAMFNSAEALANIGELDKAENYCINVMNICESQDDKIGMNGIFRCLGITYRFKKMWDKAVENINKSIVILTMLDIPFDLATTYFELGLVYREMGEVRDAIDNFGIAKNYYESVGAKNQAEEAAKIIKELEATKN